MQWMRLNRRQLLVGAGAISAAVGAGPIPFVRPALAATPAKALVIGMNIDDIISLDPGEADEVTGCEMVGQLYDRLLRYEAEDIGKLVGGVAESWTMSPDGRVWTFKIREAQVFASGNPLTAEDVVFSLQRVALLEKTPSYIFGQFGWTKDTVAGLVKQIDPMTVQLTIGVPRAPGIVVQILSSWLGSVVDKKVAMANDKNGDLGNGYLKLNSAGSGPFVLKDWHADEGVTLIANPRFRLGKPQLDRVVVRHIPEPASQRSLLEKGDIDIARNLTGDQTAALAGNPSIRIDTTSSSDSYLIALNMKDERLANPKVWQALRFAVDYDGMAATFLKDRFVKRETFLPSTFWGSIDYAPYKLDIARARTLLAEAGYPNGFELRVDTFNRSPFIEIAQSLQQTMGQAGVKLSIVTNESSQFWTLYRARKHQMALAWWAPDYFEAHSNAAAFASNPDNSDSSPAKTPAWRCAWDSGLNNEVDAAASEIDTTRRLSRYADLQRKVADNSPFIFMFEPRTQTAVRKEVHDFVVGPTFDFVYYRLARKSA